jgi:hypothetical protein
MLNKIKKNKNKFVTILVIAVIIVVAYWYGGNSDELHGWSVSDDTKASVNSVTQTDEFVGKDNETQTDELAGNSNDISSNDSAVTEPDLSVTPGQTDEEEVPGTASEVKENTSSSELNATEASSDDYFLTPTNTVENSELTPTKSALTPTKSLGNSSLSPTKPSDSGGLTPTKSVGTSGITPTKAVGTSGITPTKAVNSVSPTPTPKSNNLKCYFTIECKTVFNHTDWLSPALLNILPSDGYILKKTEVKFTEGDTVFDILKSLCKNNGISIEYSYTPAYHSTYIEGIADLYEFDCGELSGWMYSVNGTFPSYASSEYVLENGDIVEWRYTCDLGGDL